MAYLVFCLTVRVPASSTLFPYTTLFRSVREGSAPEAPRGSVAVPGLRWDVRVVHRQDRKSTRLNSSHLGISYAVFCLKKKLRSTRANSPTDCCTTPK